MNKNEFIDTIGRLAREENIRRTLHVLPSICVAQACLESAYGQSKLMMKYYAPFGIKATKNWKGAVYNSKTGEYYNNYTEITAAFRAYPDLAAAVADYYNVITNSGYYQGVLNNNNVQSAVNCLKLYATDPNYINKVLSIINKNNLTRYDNVVSGTLAGKECIVTPDIINGEKKYVKDKNGQINRLWFNNYEIIKDDGDNILIGKNKAATCWINKNKIKEVL